MIRQVLETNASRFKGILLLLLEDGMPRQVCRLAANKEIMKKEKVRFAFAANSHQR